MPRYDLKILRGIIGSGEHLTVLRLLRLKWSHLQLQNNLLLFVSLPLMNRSSMFFFLSQVFLQGYDDMIHARRSAQGILGAGRLDGIPLIFKELHTNVHLYLSVWWIQLCLFYSECFFFRLQNKCAQALDLSAVSLCLTFLFPTAPFPGSVSRQI